LLIFQLGQVDFETVVGELMNTENHSMPQSGHRGRVAGDTLSQRHEAQPPARPAPMPDSDEAQPGRLPPDSIPDLMPGVDPQQTPGIDHPPAEWD